MHAIICRNTRPPLNLYNNLYNSAYKSAIAVVARFQCGCNTCLCRYVHEYMQQRAAVNCSAAEKTAQNKIMACIIVL